MANITTVSKLIITTARASVLSATHQAMAADWETIDEFEHCDSLCTHNLHGRIEGKPLLNLKMIISTLSLLCTISQDIDTFQ